jgi:hypothetical protein
MTLYLKKHEAIQILQGVRTQIMRPLPDSGVYVVNNTMYNTSSNGRIIETHVVLKKGDRAVLVKGVRTAVFKVLIESITTQRLEGLTLSNATKQGCEGLTPLRAAFERDYPQAVKPYGMVWIADFQLVTPLKMRLSDWLSAEELAGLPDYKVAGV